MFRKKVVLIFISLCVFYGFFTSIEKACDVKNDNCISELGCNYDPPVACFT